jgi:hypothetical protein
VRPTWILLAALCSACALPVEGALPSEASDGAEGDSAGSGVGSPAGEPAGPATCGGLSSVGEAADASLASAVCEVACRAVQALGCDAASAACGGKDTITLGGMTIPCGLGIVAACVVAAAAPLGCDELCGRVFPGDKGDPR